MLYLRLWYWFMMFGLEKEGFFMEKVGHGEAPDAGLVDLSGKRGIRYEKNGSGEGRVYLSHITAITKISTMVFYFPSSAVCQFFCKITNFKMCLNQKFEINRLVQHTTSKKLTLNLQQILDTAAMGRK